MGHRARDVVFVVLLVVLPLLVFYSNNKPTRDHNLLDRVVLTIITPVQLVFDWAFDGMASTVDRYLTLVGVEEENERLRAELGSLRLKLQVFDEQSRETQRLRRLVGMPAPQHHRLLGARIIARSPSPLFKSVRIDRGSNEGVDLGAGVISPRGAVGRVAAITSSTADVMLLTDANATLDVMVQRTRALGRSRGLGRDVGFEATLDYVLRTDDVQLADVVVTSGLDAVFPKGTTVGTVTELRRKRFGLYQEVQITAAADFAHLEEVLVVVPLPSNDAATDQDAATDVAGIDDAASERRLP